MRVAIAELNLALKFKQSRSLVLEDDIVAIVVEWRWWLRSRQKREHLCIFIAVVEWLKRMSQERTTRKIRTTRYEK